MLGRVEVSVQGTSDVFPAPGYLGQSWLSKAGEGRTAIGHFGNENMRRGRQTHLFPSQVLHMDFRAGSTAEQSRDEGNRRCEGGEKGCEVPGWCLPRGK